ncbi:hypothetical protein VTK73DRAFT_4063 [Phialemonium thermophilum]|uniref:Enolase-phosphatase E1 n=1 Tax=Phialemonium thermophilum TaxID=223376 RepID=A0ABR3WVF2_9PEZI
MAPAAEPGGSPAKVVLLDIEGTVCSISFVKDILFPYALETLPKTLSAEWDDPKFVPYREAFPPEHAATPEALISHVRDLTERDVKAPYLKSLQGYLWESGYRSGALRAKLFPDVAPRLAAWRGQGVDLVVYSSGSVAAQKLLFAHTTDGDLTPRFAGYFDTVNAGPKTEAASYTRIASQYADRYEPADWLFLSDNVREVEAAKEAGMRSVVVQRPGNAPLPTEVADKHRVIQDFDELEQRRRNPRRRVRSEETRSKETSPPRKKRSKRTRT